VTIASELPALFTGSSCLGQSQVWQRMGFTRHFVTRLACGGSCYRVRGAAKLARLSGSLA